MYEFFCPTLYLCLTFFLHGVYGCSPSNILFHTAYASFIILLLVESDPISNSGQDLQSAISSHGFSPIPVYSSLLIDLDEILSCSVVIMMKNKEVLVSLLFN